MNRSGPGLRIARFLLRLLLVTAGAGLATFLVLLGIYAFSPVRALNATNRLLLGDVASVRAAGGTGFAPGLALDVWTPPADRRGPHPVLVFFYGGSWTEGRRQDYGFAARAYASRGFVVVVPDYRKLPTGRFPAFMADAAAAVRWTRANAARYGGDPARLALAGHSVGGYIAVLLALDRHWLGADRGPRAVVALAGPYDLLPLRWPPARAALGHVADPRTTQPIAFARADAPPLWLGTGDADAVIDPANSRALAARQHVLGSRSTVLRVYPGMSHSGIVMALSRPFRSVGPVLDETVAFLDANLRPAPAPPPPR